MEKAFNNKRKLEAYLLGELPEKEMRQLALAIEKNRWLKDELAKIKISHAEFMARYPLEASVQSILGKYQTSCLQKSSKPAEKTSCVKVLRYVTPLVLASLLLIVFIIPKGEKQSDAAWIQDGAKTVRIKGNAELPKAESYLLVFRKQKDQISLLQDKAVVKAGDLIQLAYYVKKQAHGMIVSIDGSGSLTLHFPKPISASSKLQNGKRIFFPIAYELDHAPDYECFFFITSDKKIAVKEILQRIQTQIADLNFSGTPILDLPQNCQQYRMILIKK